MHVPKVACKLGLNLNKQYKKSWLIRTLDQKPIVLTFGQFDHLIILDKSIWTHSIWLVVYFIDHKILKKIGTIKIDNKYVWKWLVKLSLNMFFHNKFDIFYCNI
jgi:hypothetical protein